MALKKVLVLLVFLLSCGICSQVFAADVKTGPACQALLEARWQYRVDSRQEAFSIYFKGATQWQAARSLLRHLEAAARAARKLGFRDPVPMPLGNSGGLAVFLRQGKDSFVVPTKRPIWREGAPAWPVFIGFDADDLADSLYTPSLAAHEFHHAVQAAYTWMFPSSIYEMSSNYFQEKVQPGAGVNTWNEIEAFQNSPERSILHDDGHESDFMYGAWIYLEFLEQKYFQGRPGFLRNLWEQMAAMEARAPAPERRGEEDLRQAFAGILPAGVSYEDTLAAFAVWRATPHWDLSVRHLKGRPLPLPRVQNRLLLRSIAEKTSVRDRLPELYGAHYIEVEKPKGCGALSLRFEGSDNAHWRMQEIDRSSEQVWIAVQAFPLRSNAVARGAADGVPEPIFDGYDYTLSVQCSGVL